MTLAQPAWLLLLILLPFLGVGALLIARVRKKQWSAFVAPRLRSALLRRGSPLPRWFGFMFLLAACGAIIVALSRPRAEAGTRMEKTLGRNVLIALDLSRSMLVEDVKPNRLSQAKLVIFELLEAMPNERIGLLGFAGSAYLYAPLTIDHSAVRETVEQIDETWATRGGSNLSAALALAIETFKKTGQKNNALVILSDGEENDGNLDVMIAEAERAGIYILAIGVGTEDGDYVPSKDFPGNRMLDRDAKPVLSRLQTKVMRELAVETKGRFAVAGSGVDIPAIVKSSIKDLDAFEMEGRERKITVEFYQWLLLPAIIFLLGSVVAATRWRGVNPVAATAVSGMLISFSPPSARADAVADARAALDAKDWPQARERYNKLAEGTLIEDRRARFRLGEGTAAYRAGDYRQARTAFSKAIAEGSPEVLENAHLGMGNTLFQLGWNGIAGESYPNNPDELPDLGKFDALIKEQLAKLTEGEEEDTSGYVRFETLTRNWADAVRHYDSSLAAGNSSNNAAGRNRTTTITYLKRLQELLQEEEEKTEQSIPQPQPGEGEPREEEGESDGKQEKGEKGEGQEQPEGERGEGGEESDQKGSGDDEQEDPEKGESGKKDDEKKDDSDDGEGEPGETPEDRARRILKENADLEKGPLSPGKLEFSEPEKDW